MNPHLFLSINLVHFHTREVLSPLSLVWKKINVTLLVWCGSFSHCNFLRSPWIWTPQKNPSARIIWHKSLGRDNAGKYRNKTFPAFHTNFFINFFNERRHFLFQKRLPCSHPDSPCPPNPYLGFAIQPSDDEIPRKHFVPIVFSFYVHLMSIPFISEWANSFCSNQITLSLPPLESLT